MAFGDYLDSLAALGISSVAAALSSTLIKSELLPEQLHWLGTAGTVVAACMIAVGFVLRNGLKSRPFKLVLVIVVLSTCTCLIWLRAARVSEVELHGALHNYLHGGMLTQAGLDAQAICKSDSVEVLIKCAGREVIPTLYGKSYSFAYYLYVFDYLLLLAAFVALISGLELKTSDTT
jgi:hypothetical protein